MAGKTEHALGLAFAFRQQGRGRLQPDKALPGRFVQPAHHLHVRRLHRRYGCQPGDNVKSIATFQVSGLRFQLYLSTIMSAVLSAIGPAKVEALVTAETLE